MKLLQDKFEDETKFNTKTPYILNALYNSIIQSDPHGSYILRNRDRDIIDEKDDNDKPDDSSKKSRTKSTQKQRKKVLSTLIALRQENSTSFLTIKISWKHCTGATKNLNQNFI